MLIIKSKTLNIHVEAEELNNYIGKTVFIHGMIYKIREMSGFAFIILMTKGTFLQCVYSPDFSSFPLTELKDNMSVIFKGSVVAEDRSKSGFEVRIIDVEILSKPVEEPPVVINNKEIVTSLETLLDCRPVTLRNSKEIAIFKIQACLCEAFRVFLSNNKFTEIHSPKIVFSGAEGGSDVFKLNYFGKEAYLTQSPQFYKQMMVGVFERVYEIAPVFRAEKHDTSRHLNEYTSVDIEMGFIEEFYDIMRLETKMLEFSFQYLEQQCTEELKLLKVTVPKINEIPAISFIEAKELVCKNYNRQSSDYEDFEPEEEKLLCEIIKNETGSDFVFVTHFKSSKRPFYVLDSKDNSKLTESFDLLFKGMEITTGGQRIHDYNEQITKMKKRKMNIDSFSGYLMAHKHGLPPHGGFGLGLERLTAKLCGFDNVRRATLFPRDINRLTP